MNHVESAASDAPDTPGSDRVAVEIDVSFVGGQPTRIEYFHTIYGLMKFDVEERVATLNPQWDRLGDGTLKAGFTRGITTGDVLRAVEQLAFIDDINVVDSE